MWQLDNRTPFAAERAWVRDRDGAEVWLVAVKATFDIQPDGTTTVAKEQPPVLRMPVHHGEPALSSIKYEADLVLTKHTTDIIVVGHAHAPAGQAVTHLDCGFKVGPVQKLLRVYGERRWGRFGAGEAQHFGRVPLLYERAYGGADARAGGDASQWEVRNPVGMGLYLAAEHAREQPLPQIEDPQQPITSWDDRHPPAGFGAIASHWQPRAAFAGTYGEEWQKTRAPLLAADMDDRFYQCAPPDQQAPQFLRGGEPVILQNLSALGRIAFSLPKLYFGFETRFLDGSREQHPNKALHTVILEPDFPRVSLVWHTALPCHFKVHKLDRTLITLKTDLSTGRAPADKADLTA
jgi:hypothetical protein